MKIALLSDIHGNLAALEPALEAVLAARPDKIAVLGDLIGYYYDAAAVIELVRAHADIVIRGNHERIYADMLEGRSDGAAYRAKYGSSLDLALETLTKPQNQWILNLPDRFTAEIGGKRLHFAHEAPNVGGGYLYPDSTGEMFDAALPDTVDALFCGHSHHALAVRRGSRLICNPGSIGQARDVGGLAQWAVVDLETMAVEQKRTPYDPAPVEQAAVARDPDLPYLRNVLRRGRKG